MSCARLFHGGREDRQMAKKVSRARDQLPLQGVAFIEFSGLDQGECSTTGSMESRVVPTMGEWISQQWGSTAGQEQTASFSATSPAFESREGRQEFPSNR